MPKKKKFLEKEDDDINKKFDEMEEILLELKKKEELKNSIAYSNSASKEKVPIYDRLQEQKPHVPSYYHPIEDEELRLRMFSLEGGLNPMAGQRSISNIKSHLVKGSILNMYSNNVNL
jgi:hypothetical protein